MEYDNNSIEIEISIALKANTHAPGGALLTVCLLDVSVSLSLHPVSLSSSWLAFGPVAPLRSDVLLFALSIRDVSNPPLLELFGGGDRAGA
tara:strand:- start:193 stop:465 length:273 start_codon:yes stop_codon:yes gene_type:complete